MDPLDVNLLGVPANLPEELISVTGVSSPRANLPDELMSVIGVKSPA
jgi:hypothetical protein